MIVNQELSFLVVDDFEPIRNTINRMLVDLGYRHIVLAANGKIALQLLLKERIDLIITDWNMPVMNGIELLRAVRNSATHAAIPVLMVTAEVDRANVIFALQQGVTDIICKPFTPKTFRDKLHAMLKKGVHVPPKGRSRTLPDVPKSDSSQVQTAKAVRSTAGDKPRVLLVDDDASSIELAKSIIDNRYLVESVGSGEAALQQTRQQPPDLIILDVSMPGIGGFETCRRLKESPYTEAIPVIFFSANDDPDAIIEGFNVGGVDYISKPPIPEVMMARINAHMAIRKSQHDMQESLEQHIRNFRLLEDVERMTRHDIKGPLSAVLAAVDLLESYGDPEQIVVIRESAQMILKMVNNSLDIYKMEQGTYQYEPQQVNIAATLKKSLRSCEMVAKAHSVTVALTGDTEVVVFGEELLCQALFINLINNAIEASPAEATVQIVVTPTVAATTIEICNQGVIPEEIRERFFEKYVTSGKKGGNGLGTYSAMLMAKTMKGELSFTSSDSKGTVLMVKLPAMSDKAAIVRSD
ncbi:MAG: hybrid sensor histidine kinase/response regulator [Gammaproteobacteria bacterium]|nr:hybrid sensor histidine kinase/response regulator [Gammaproteobacteria bacterium]